MRRSIVPQSAVLMLCALAGCGGTAAGGSGSGIPTPFTVTTPNGLTALDTRETLTVTATQSVSWSLELGSGCTNGVYGCGSLSNTSGTTVTYTPPQTLLQGNAFQVRVEGSNGVYLAGADLVVGPIPSLTIENKTATIQAGSGPVHLSANVANDYDSRAPVWSLTGSSCSASGNPCGTLTNNGFTYVPPSEAPASNPQATLTAASVEDPTITDQFTFTITPASTVVSLSNTFNTVAAGGNAQLITATVKHDVGGLGVTWSLVAGSPQIPCQPQCGSLGQVTSNTIGLVTTATISYSPAAGPPVPPTPDNTPEIIATSLYDSTASATDAFSIQDFSCGTGSESMLLGQYAFMLQGFFGSGNGTPFAVAGSFGADGTGNITNGEEDLNEFISYQNASISSANSTYSVGPDGRGCLSLTVAGGRTTKYRFALGGISAGIASKGSILQTDDTSGTGSRASGILRLQDTTSFAQNKLRSNYAFGVNGWINGAPPEHLAIAGSCGVTNQSGHEDSSGLQITGFNFAGCSIGTIGSATGRATGLAPFPFPPILFMINSDEFFIISSGPTLYAGRAISTGNSFTVDSVSGNYILHYNEMGARPVDLVTGAGGQFIGEAYLGIMDFMSGTTSGKVYTYSDTSSAPQPSIVDGAYSVDSTSGRLDLFPGGFPSDAIYLTSPIDDIFGFYFNADAAAIGILESQPTAVYSTSSTTGGYIFTQDEPNQSLFTNSSGSGNISPSGSVSGTSDESSPSGLLLNQPVSLTLTVNPDGTGNGGANTFAVTNGMKIFILQGSINESQVSTLERK